MPKKTNHPFLKVGPIGMTGTTVGSNSEVAT